MKKPFFKFGLIITAFIAVTFLLLPVLLQRLSGRIFGESKTDGSLITIQGQRSLDSLLYLSNSKLMTAGYDNGPRLVHSIKQWSASDGTALGTRNLRHGVDNFSADGRFFVTLFYRSSEKRRWIEIINANNFSRLSRWPEQPQDSSSHWTLSPDGSRVAGAVSRNAFIHLSRSDITPETKITRPGGIECRDSATGKLLWFAEESRSNRRLDLMTYHTYLAFSPDGKLLAEASTVIYEVSEPWFDKRKAKVKLMLRDAKTGRLLQTLAEDKVICHSHGDLAGGWHALSFSPDGKSLIALGGKEDEKSSGAKRGEIQIWDVQTGRIKWRQQRDNIHPIAAAFSSDNSLLACGSEIWNRADSIHGGDVTLWDAKTGKLLRIMTRETQADARDYAWHARVRKVQRYIKRKTTGSAGWTRSIDDKSFPVTHLAFSPDGKRLAAAHEDGVIKIWAVP